MKINEPANRLRIAHERLKKKHARITKTLKIGAELLDSLENNAFELCKLKTHSENQRRELRHFAKCLKRKNNLVECYSSHAESNHKYSDLLLKFIKENGLSEKLFENCKPKELVK